MITLNFFSSLKVSMKEWLFAGAIFYLAYYSILVVYLKIKSKQQQVFMLILQQH